MITIEEFAEKKKSEVKSIKTIRKWLDNGYIQGAALDENGEYQIPDNARCPYTEKRSKSGGTALFKSIAKAYSKGKGVTPQLYSITQEELDHINKYLIDNGYIAEEHLDGLTYYNITPSGMNYISIRNTEAYRIIRDCVETAIVAAGTVIVNSSKWTSFERFN